MKKKVFVVGGLILLAGAAGAGGWYYYKQNYGDSASASGEVAYVTKISTLLGEDSGVMNRFAGVVEPQETVKVNIESGRTVTEVKVKTGDEVKKGQLLFEYDLSSIQDSLKEAQLALDRLKNEALSLNEQITTLEKEKKKANKSSQLSYTIEIETNKMNLKKNEYDQVSKQAEIDKLQAATTNTEVRSEIDGVIQKIDTSKLGSDDGDTLDDSMSADYGSSDSSDNAFITILSTGAYRIKGQVNEQNRNTVVPGSAVIVRSRVDENQIWHGTMGAVDEQNSSNSSSSNSYLGMSSGDDTTSSSTYPFYVTLDSSEGLMLGQHVYIEMDEGQEEQKTGIWIGDYYIVDADTDSPYVWAVDSKGRLEKRSVILGQHDDNLSEYEIADGLTEDDSIAFPSDSLVEGMSTKDVSEMTDEELESVDMESNMDAGEYSDGDIMEPLDEDYSSADFESGVVDENMDATIDGKDSYDASEDITEDDSFDDSTEDFTEDTIEDPVMYGSDDTEAAG
ncbi:efflux RND transporter periplasmic adaptor subunit [Blautia sp. HCP3S3_H10_1]|uniref:efflux RND transporter periplasmic adaptor subunit n=1 Tax=unclassified Blautia TaxID=2648079 RepID=UPI003F91FCB9|nr:biotin/lipoyl-binding protein [Clostridia bacterium]